MSQNIFSSFQVIFPSVASIRDQSTAFLIEVKTRLLKDNLLPISSQTTMKPVYAAILLCVMLSFLRDLPSVRGDCWWTGCQPNTWEVRGCSNYGRTEEGNQRCKDEEGSPGKKYYCCKDVILEDDGGEWVPLEDRSALDAGDNNDNINETEAQDEKTYVVEIKVDPTTGNQIAAKIWEYVQAGAKRSS